jgi:probable rRNA maturation factor
MTIRFSDEVEADFPFDAEAVGREVIETALSIEGFPYEAEVDLTLTDDEAIHELNRTYRSIDRATDVLSFPLIEYPSAGDFSELEDCDDFFSPESGEAMLGDIVISVDHVREQAESFGHSLKREYAFLICHSMLHLMGYDHMEDDERIEMEAEQKRIMEALQINRDTVED